MCMMLALSNFLKINIYFSRAVEIKTQKSKYMQIRNVQSNDM